MTRKQLERISLSLVVSFSIITALAGIVLLFGLIFPVEIFRSPLYEILWTVVKSSLVIVLTASFVNLLINVSIIARNLENLIAKTSKNRNEK